MVEGFLHKGGQGTRNQTSKEETILNISDVQKQFPLSGLHFQSPGLRIQTFVFRFVSPPGKVSSLRSRRQIQHQGFLCALIEIG